MTLLPNQLEVLEKYKREQSLHPDPTVIPEIIRNLTDYYTTQNMELEALHKQATPNVFRFFGESTVDYLNRSRKVLEELKSVEDILKPKKENEDEDMEDTGFQYDLTASYEVNYSPMSDGYDDYDTYKIKLKLESEDPDFIVQPELELDLTMHNKGKLEQLLKLIDTVFDLGKYNSENYLCIDAKSIETSDLEL
jgi:predicted nucleotidyltransferase